MNAKITILCSLACLSVMVALAFPPAPHHQLYGMVRDEYGTPLNLSEASVVFVRADGTELRATPIAPKVEPGVNYQLSVPLDSGVTPAIYKPTAVVPTQDFRLHVRIDQALYLPIEMVGSFSNIGQPAERTRLNLTLGEDSDGDGLPDAWERALIALLGGNLTLADIQPGDDADGDGLSNRDEYLAGTFAFDPTDGFSLALSDTGQDPRRIQFLALSGRTYSFQESADLQIWKPVPFRVVSGGSSTEFMDHYQSTDVRLLQIEVSLSSVSETNRFFRGFVQ